MYIKDILGERMGKAKKYKERTFVNHKGEKVFHTESGRFVGYITSNSKN